MSDYEETVKGLQDAGLLVGADEMVIRRGSYADHSLEFPERTNGNGATCPACGHWIPADQGDRCLYCNRTFSIRPLELHAVISEAIEREQRAIAAELLRTLEEVDDETVGKGYFIAWQTFDRRIRAIARRLEGTG